MKILMVYPETPESFWSFSHTLRFVSKRSAFPPLGLLTVAAMLPAEWDVRLIDMNVEPLRERDLEWADYVMISAMIIHTPSVRAVAERCRRLGKTVIAGGPLFTTGHHEFPEIGHFVVGEAERVMADLVADMERGALRATYESTSDRPALTESPQPRFSLVDMKKYVTMSVQFSRGCPYDCEFCDIIVMNGRVPRTKTPAQLVGELEALRVRGWNGMVFVVDDNFIGNKKLAKAALREVIAWRERTKPRFGFFTEASVNLADDPELIDLMIRAGFKKVFIGIETPSVENLEECHKLQNTGRDLVDSIKIVQRAGMEVMAGFIVGFDNDREDVFHRQLDFIQRSGVVTAMVGLLNALPKTRLHERLQRENRLEAASTGNNTDAVLNFRPVLDREFLVDGYRELMRNLYEPHVYSARIRTFLREHRPNGPKLSLTRADLRAFVKSLWLLGVRHRGRWAYWRLSASTLVRRPRQFSMAIELAIVGHHFRRVAAQL